MDTGRSFGRPQTRLSAEHSARRSPSSPISYSRQHSGPNPRSASSGDESDADQPDRQTSSRFDVSDDRTRPTDDSSSYRGYHTYQREPSGTGYRRDIPFVPPASTRQQRSSTYLPHSGRTTGDHSSYSGPPTRTSSQTQRDGLRSATRSRNIPLAPPEENYESDGSSESQRSGNSRMSYENGPRNPTGEASERSQGHAQRSGTDTRTRRDTRISVDESFPSRTTSAQDQTGYRYDKDRYPAYDSTTRRIGLDHIRYGENPEPPEPPTPRSYYRPRTQKYPTNLDDVPHVMSMSLNSPNHLVSPPLPPTPRDSFPSAPDATPRAGHRTSSTQPPEDQDDASANARKKRKPGGRAPPATDYASTDIIPDATEHVRKSLGLGPIQEVSLTSLDDPPPGQKPPYSYPALIQLAILGSARKRLTLSEIYTAIEERFEYYRNSSDSAWQSSIRHTLSLKSCFRSVNKPITEPGKGNYWVVDYSFGDGNKRVRKRNPRPKKAEREKREKQSAIAARREEEEESSDEEMDNDEPIPSHAPTSTSRSQIDDCNIDPELRNQGHVVGEGRLRGSAGPTTRSNGRRANSPYASTPPSSQTRPTSGPSRSGNAPSPQHLAPPSPSSPQATRSHQPSTGQGAYGQTIYGQSALGLSVGQPSLSRQPAAQATFGKPSLPAPTRSQSTRLTPSTWAQYGSAAPVPYTGPATSSTRDHPGISGPSSPTQQYRDGRSGSVAASASSQAREIRNAAIRRPAPRPGTEVVTDSGGLVTTRRVASGADSNQQSRPSAWSSHAPGHRGSGNYSPDSNSSQSQD